MFTRHGLPMNRYTFVYFRKPQRFRAQMPTVTQGHLVRSEFFCKDLQTKL